MLSSEMYEAVKMAKAHIADMDLGEILRTYLTYRCDHIPVMYRIAFMKVVESGTFIDQTWGGEFCLSFEMPGTRVALDMLRDNKITIAFNCPVDEGFSITHSVNFDLYRMIQGTERANAMRRCIGEFNMTELLKVLNIETDDQ